jgi:hypothetical protein
LKKAQRTDEFGVSGPQSSFLTDINRSAEFYTALYSLDITWSLVGQFSEALIPSGLQPFMDCAPIRLKRSGNPANNAVESHLAKTSCCPAQEVHVTPVIDLVAFVRDVGCWWLLPPAKLVLKGTVS